MQSGCKRDVCINVNCKNNPNFLYHGRNKEEHLKIVLDLWNQCQTERKYEMWEICCHTDHMSSITHSLQAANIEKIRDIGYFSTFVQSPYALSLSFLKDPTILGRNDDLGQSKYSLNLDEELV